MTSSPLYDDVMLLYLYTYLPPVACIASSPGPFPAFQCCTLQEKREASCNTEKLGVGLGTRLVTYTCMYNVHVAKELYEAANYIRGEHGKSLIHKKL